MKKIFISHSSNDSEIANNLCEFLEKNGKKCFIAPRDIRTGFEYAEEIIKGIDEAELIILLLSQDSNASPHVLREIERAVSKNIPIIICKLEEVELSKSMEYFLMTHQWMESDSKLDFAKILNAVEQRESTPILNNEENKNSKKKLIPALSAAVAILLIAFVVMLCVLMKENETPTGNTSQNNTTGGLENANSDIKVGDTIEFGSYNGEKIFWRVLKISEEDNTAMLIAKDIISIKAFDAPESGKYGSYNDILYTSNDSQVETDMNLQIMVRGNSAWDKSNIRTWLNSEAEVVKYEDMSPKSTAMSEKANGYDLEAGFLHGFTTEEIEAIVPVTLTTKGNALSEEEYIETTDRVYLLSEDDLKLFEEADVSMYATITDVAKEKDSVKWYKAYLDTQDNEYYFWWLREPVEGTSSMLKIVLNGYGEEITYNVNAGSEGYGVRPAITIDLSKY